MKEKKAYAFKAALVDNTITGGPAVIGNLDMGGDVIFPGSFKGILPDFLKNGFVAFGHEWDDLPIAYPTVAEEKGRILYSEAMFHSHQAAQDAKMVAKERLAANMNVGLSIGFSCMMDGVEFFDGGEMLLMWAKEKGYDMSLFDKPGILACKDWIRGIIQFEALYEWSIVPAPMNPEAMADGIKAWTPEQAKARVWCPGSDIKTASGDTSLPIAARDHAWDGPGAEKRVREWSGAQDAPNAKYRKAFLWYDSENADKFGSYHLGFADVLDGTLTIIPRGVFACAGVMMGARGADGEMYADAKPKIETLYARFRKEFNDDSIVVPWADGKSAPSIVIATVRDFEAFLRDVGGFSRSQAVKVASHGYSALLRDAASDDASPEPADETPETKASETPAETPAPPAADPNIIAVSDEHEETDDERNLRYARLRVGRKLMQQWREIDARTAKNLARAGVQEP